VPEMTRYSIKGRDIILHDHPGVYPPSEDTFLLVEALKISDGNVLELGTGSGLAAIHCALRGARVVATDINPQAVRLARRNASSNGVAIDVLRADLFEGVGGAFDAIVFNPPYLPTSPEDVTDDRWPDASVNGGPDGLEIVRRFLAGLGGRLAPGGRGYILTSSLSGRVDFTNRFRARKVASCALPFETLTVHELKEAA